MIKIWKEWNGEDPKGESFYLRQNDRLLDQMARELVEWAEEMRKKLRIIPILSRTPAYNPKENPCLLCLLLCSITGTGAWRAVFDDEKTLTRVYYDMKNMSQTSEIWVIPQSSNGAAILT